MPGIIEDPQVIRDALPAFHDLVANDGPRRHFAEYLTGLSVADRMTIGGIHREVAPTTGPSGFFIKSVGTRGKHYLLELRRFCPKGLGACLGDPFEDHTTRFGRLIDGPALRRSWGPSPSIAPSPTPRSGIPSRASSCPAGSHGPMSGSGRSTASGSGRAGA